MYGPPRNTVSVVPGVRNENGTLTQEPPETLEIIFVCDRRLAFPT